MALLQYTVTLGASPSQAVTAHTPFKYLRMESEASNAIVYYGNSSSVSSTSYAGSILANTATINNAVIIGAFDTLPSNLDEFWFTGTNGQKIHLTVIT